MTLDQTDSARGELLLAEKGNVTCVNAGIDTEPAAARFGESFLRP